RLSPRLPWLSPAFLAAALFLYAPLPRYRGRGVPPWASGADLRRSAGALLLLAAVGAAAFLLFVRLPLPPDLSPYRGSVPLSGATVAHLLFLVALPEEVFFRGYLYDAFEEAGWEPVLPTALLFAAGHVAISPSAFRALTFFPGVILGLGRKASGNVYVPVLAHFLFNLYPSLIGGPS
ncbi:MAG TPA: CPBP family intramembrane glutamic endopeptidase, partial [Candidatus Deferrimicrobiaceae bacterium]